MILLLKEAEADREWKKSLFPWIGPFFAAGMCIFFMLRGEYVANVIYAVLMGALLWFAIQGLLPLFDMKRKQPNNVFLCIITLFFCMMEYAEWTASCFWGGDTLENPYFWFDALLTLSFPLYLPAVRKAVER